ncbi:MAG: hypothetical protein NZ809_00445 [Thermodesulfovibrio sp.]|nr:hypothetical protein [Thermodesulfovibrio sp.]
MSKAIIYGKREDKIKKIIEALKIFGFECVSLSSLEDIIHSIEVDEISVIVVEESENSKEIIQTLRNLPMYKRRNLFIALWGDSLPTMDRFLAFKEGFDLVVNSKHIDNFSLYFKRSYSEYQNLYKAFKEFATEY